MEWELRVTMIDQFRNDITGINRVLRLVDRLICPQRVTRFNRSNKIIMEENETTLGEIR